MYCSECGAQLDQDAGYCHACGTRRAPGTTAPEVPVGHVAAPAAGDGRASRTRPSQRLLVSIAGGVVAAIVLALAVTHHATGTRSASSEPPSSSPIVLRNQNDPPPDPDTVAAPNEPSCVYAADGRWAKDSEGSGFGASYPPSAGWSDWTFLEGPGNNPAEGRFNMARIGRCINSTRLHFLFVEARQSASDSETIPLRLVTNKKLVVSCPVEPLAPDSSTFDVDADIGPQRAVWVGAIASPVYHWPPLLYGCIGAK